MIYKKYQSNHAVLTDREEALELFLKQDYKGMRHNAIASRLAHHARDQLL